MTEAKKRSPFDYISMINDKSGRHIMEDDSVGFEPFIINKGFSNNLDSVFFANEVNQYQLDKQLLFDFYYYGLSKKKRYGKWFKKDSTNQEHIDLIKEYFDYSTQKAIDVYPLLIDSIDDIKTALDKGGVMTRRTKK